jgi:hypothetical protein
MVWTNTEKRLSIADAIQPGQLRCFTDQELHCSPCMSFMDRYRRTSTSIWVWTFIKHPATTTTSIKWRRRHTQEPLIFLKQKHQPLPSKHQCQCYSTLARSSLEYAFKVWSPAKKKIINQIEVVQLRAACFSSGDYLDELAVLHLIWTPLEVRRNQAFLVIMYRIVYDLVDLPPATYLQQS